MIYTCSICGITSEEHKNWGPICRKTGRRVCDICCWRCEYHTAWSGIWRCAYRTEEIRMQEARQRAQDRFNTENEKISEAFYKRRREEAKRRAIKAAKARKKR